MNDNCTNSSATNCPVLSLASIERAIASIGPEPISEWMRQQGRPPEVWTLYLPDTPEARRITEFTRSYVCVSGAIDRPVFVNRLLMGF